MSADDRKIDPHERLTPEELRRYWQLGDFTAAGYLFHLVRALRKDGWWLQIKNVSQFCQEWGLDRRAFYRAKAQLLLNGRIQEHTDNLFLRVLGRSEEKCDINVTPETSMSQSPEEKCDPNVTLETFMSQVEEEKCDINVTTATQMSQLPEKRCDIDVTRCDPNVTGCDKFVTSTPLESFQGKDSGDPSTLSHLSSQLSSLNDRVAAANAEATGAIEQSGSLNSEPVEVGLSQPNSEQKSASELPIGSEGVNVPLSDVKKRTRKKQPRSPQSAPAVSATHPDLSVELWQKWSPMWTAFYGDRDDRARFMSGFDWLIGQGIEPEKIAEGLTFYVDGKNRSIAKGRKDQVAKPPRGDRFFTGREGGESYCLRAYELHQEKVGDVGVDVKTGLHWSESGDWQTPKDDLGDDLSLIKVLWGELKLSWDDARVQGWMTRARDMNFFPKNTQAISTLPDWVVRKFAHDLKLSQ